MTEILCEPRTERKHITFPAIFYERKLVGVCNGLQALYGKEDISA